jgi:O-methyltransferase involved in polyketide biosynthesis/acyl-coenzyme A thioesterase PaaI-like protein
VACFQAYTRGQFRESTATRAHRIEFNAPNHSMKPLSLVPDTSDLQLHTRNCDTRMTTQRLRALVPLLEFVGCVVQEIGPERTVLGLPLLAAAMNQNGTHQAAVFYLVADYVFGVAMFGVLPGVYVTGVHDRCAALPVQFWLKRGTVHHLAPGTGQLRAEIAIPTEQQVQLRAQLFERGRGELTGKVCFFQDGQLVAETEHTMGIYADLPRVAGTRANIFQVQNLKTSALMIAGLRADALSQAVAADQGRALARRMTIAAPQLPALVSARTTHIHQVIRAQSATCSQVLVLGVGLDPKPVEHSSDLQRWFGLDLRDMLKEREQRFAKAGAIAANAVCIAADLRLQGWEESLLRSGFAADKPTLVIVEGLSMYLTKDELAGLLVSLRQLLQSPDTRVWLDHVTPALFEHESQDVRSFLASMNRLGEPFILGFVDAATVASGSWATEQACSARDVLATSDPIHNEYRFSVLAPC